MRAKFKLIEISIFSVFSLVFLNSVYSFLQGSFQENSKKPAAAMRAVAKSEPIPSESRSDFASYEVQCLEKGETFEADAIKVRIVGRFCGSPTARKPASTPLRPIESRVENRTSHYSATIFTDQESDRFSTDFIPLEPGANAIELTFDYPGGSRRTVQVNVKRK